MRLFFLRLRFKKGAKQTKAPVILKCSYILFKINEEREEAFGEDKQMRGSDSATDDEGTEKERLVADLYSQTDTYMDSNIRISTLLCTQKKKF